MITMNNTTKPAASADLMFALSQLLEAHGTSAVLTALRDAADACADHEGSKVERSFRKGSRALEDAMVAFDAAETAGSITLDQGACVLADSGDEEAVSS